MANRQDSITLTAADVKALSTDGGTVNGNVICKNSVQIKSVDASSNTLLYLQDNNGGARSIFFTAPNGTTQLQVNSNPTTVSYIYSFNVDGGFSSKYLSTGAPLATSWAQSWQRGYAGAYMDSTLDNQGMGAVAALSWGYQHGGGYPLRTSWGNVGNGTGNWGNTTMVQFGDSGSKVRYWLFTPEAGDLVTSTGGDGGFAGNYTYQKAATSDATLKHDITYDDGKASYENIRKLKPCTFVYNGDYLERVRRGIIAQDALRYIDRAYVKLVPAAPEFDEEGNRCDKDDTLALDNNVIQMDTALALHHAIAKIEALTILVTQLQAEVQALKA